MERDDYTRAGQSVYGMCGKVFTPNHSPTLRQSTVRVCIVSEISIGENRAGTILKGRVFTRPPLRFDSVVAH